MKVGNTRCPFHEELWAVDNCWKRRVRVTPVRLTPFELEGHISKSTWAVHIGLDGFKTKERTQSWVCAEEGVVVRGSGEGVNMIKTQHEI